MTATSDIARILAAFRAQHGWQAGYVWDPRGGVYREGSLDVFAGSEVIGSYRHEPQCQAVAASLPGGPLARERCGCATCCRELA